MVAPPPTSNFDAYRACCAEAAAQQPHVWTFKRDPRYTRILEHVTYVQGLGYLDLLQEEFPHLWPDCLPILRQLAPLNDDLGKAQRMWFPALDLECSPTNLRYLYQALRIRRHMEAVCPPGPQPIVELGGGYGGLALYLRTLNLQMMRVSIGTHTIVDVPEACALTAAYARALKVPVRTVNGLDADALAAALLPAGTPPFFVSIFAFSEFDAETRAWYEQRLVRHCAHGLIVWNFVQPLLPAPGVTDKPLGGPVYPFVDAPLTTEPERPSTGPGNLVVTW